MSIISECLRQIMAARYGKDVRQSIHDGIKELDEVARTAQGSATLSAQTAIEKANEALTASQAAIESAKQAKAYSDNAQAVAGVTVATQDNAGLVKGGENHIGLDGTLELVVKTTEASMPNSRKGRLAVDEIGGVCVQDNIPSPAYPQEIKKTVVSEIKTHGVQMIPTKITLNNTGLSAIIDEQNRIVLSGTTNDTAAADLYVYGEWGGNNDLGIRGQVSIGTNLGAAYLLHKNTIVGMSLAGSAINMNITDDNYITAIMVRFPANTTYNGVLELMLNEGSEALPYEPYTESVITLSQPITLNGIGDVMDYIDVERGKVVRKFAEYDLSTLTQHYTSNRNGWYALLNELKPLAKCLFEKYKYSEAAWCSDNYAGVDKDKTFWCQNNDSANKASGYMIAELATPTEEALPITDQIALNSLKTFDGVTYIEFVSEVQPTFAGKYGASLVGGIALEGAMKSRENSLALSGDSFEFKEHGLTFKGLKIGKMMVLHVNGELDYGLTDENKVMTFETKIPDGFKPYIDTNAAVMNIKSRDSEGNRITVLYNLGIGRLGTLMLQVEWKSSTGQTLLSPQATGIPLYMSMSYISE